MNLRTAGLVLAASAVALSVWLLRYEMVPLPAGGQGKAGFVYRLDRWTGEVRWIYEDQSGIVKDKP